ncbi:MAG TPA: hypothetical protein VIY08_16335 [Candidatus Nitrosocosmicus sp.]
MNIYTILVKKIGIIPLSLKTILERRIEYKKRKNNILYQKNSELRNCYDNRQAVLKWSLVTSFGNLGFIPISICFLKCIS